MDPVAIDDRRPLPLNKRESMVPDHKSLGCAGVRPFYTNACGDGAKRVRTSTFRCRRCGRPIQWARIQFLRSDGYVDWRIDVWCPECGEVLCPGILAEIRDIHLEEVIGAIHRMQDKAIGPDLKAFLDGFTAKR